MNVFSPNLNIPTMFTGNITMHHETESVIEIEWKIEKFLSLLRNSKRNYSPSFTWSADIWQFSLEYSSVNVLELYLHRFQSEKRLSVVFKFGVRLVNGTTEIRCSLTKNFDISKASFGTQEFILKEELIERKHELLPGGFLTLTCIIAHLDTLTKPQKVKFESLDVLSSNFKTLFDCMKYSDITITVGEESYPAHKAILAARSDVFAAMFQHNMEEVNSGMIHVVDCDPVSFKDFLLYLYTGKVRNFSSNNVCHLYRMADKYNVQELKIFCIDYMKANLSPSALFNFMILANQYNEIELISTIQEFFNRNALDIIKGNEWEDFLKQNFPIANQLLINMLKSNKSEYHEEKNS